MRNYIKNKGFIPEKFILQAHDKSLKNEKKIIVIFLCLNLIYLPLNISLLSKNYNEPVAKEKIETYSKKATFDVEDIRSIANVLFSHDVKECDVTNENGSIVIGNMEEADIFNGKNIFKVEEVLLRDDGNYELKVNGYE
ncbi:MAG: hypothetical protein E7207_08815 [Clostridium butyricum]|nr:hypothetical protein [Clostridium butyricum]